MARRFSSFTPIFNPPGRRGAPTRGAATGTPPTGLEPIACTIDRIGEDPTFDDPIIFLAIFASPVTGFTGADVSLSGTAGATTATVFGFSTAYSVQVTGMTTTGTVIASIPAGVAQAETGPRVNGASTSTNNEVDWVNPVCELALIDTFASPFTLQSTAREAANGDLGYAVFVTQQAQDRIMLVDISDPLNLASLDDYQDATNMDGPDEVIWHNGLIFVGADARVVSFDPTGDTLTMLHSLSGFSGAPSLHPFDANNIIAVNSQGLFVINVSNPSAMTITSGPFANGAGNGVTVIGTNAFVCDLGTDRIRAINLSNLASPSLTSTFLHADLDRVQDVHVVGPSHIVGICDDTARYVVVNVTNPASMSHVVSVFPNGTQGSAIADNMGVFGSPPAILSTGLNTDDIALVTFADPTSPVIEHVLANAAFNNVVGGYIYALGSDLYAIGRTNGSNIYSVEIPSCFGITP